MADDVPVPPPETAAPRLVRADGAIGTAEELARVQPFDFRNPVCLSEATRRELHQQNEKFQRYLASRLSLMLRLDCGVEGGRLETETFGKFCDGLPEATHLCLFQVDPWPGVGVMEISPRLALAMVDRLLGGAGVPPEAPRELTEIEIVLLEDVIRVILDEWIGQWPGGEGLEPTLVGHENNGSFLRTSARDEVMLSLGMACRIGEDSLGLQIAVPYPMVEAQVPVVRERGDAIRGAGGEGPRSWQPIYAQVAVPVSAQWELPAVALREIATWREGDTIELPMAMLEQTRVLLNGQEKFQGTVGVENDRVAVTIDQKLTAETTGSAAPLNHG